MTNPADITAAEPPTLPVYASPELTQANPDGDPFAAEVDQLGKHTTTDIRPSLAEELAAAAPVIAADTTPDAYIWVQPGRLGGKPCVGGTRLSVDAVTRFVWGGSVDTAIIAYPHLTRTQVLVACWFQASYGPMPWRRRWAKWAAAHEGAMWAGRFDDIPDPIDDPDAAAEAFTEKSESSRRAECPVCAGTFFVTKAGVRGITTVTSTSVAGGSGVLAPVSCRRAVVTVAEHKTEVAWNLTASRFWRVCSCGEKGKKRYGYPGLAESAGAGHSAARNAAAAAVRISVRSGTSGDDRG